MTPLHDMGVAELAAFVWACTRGRAIARLARLLGVPLLTEAEVARQVAAFEAAHAA